MGHDENIEIMVSSGIASITLIQGNSNVTNSVSFATSILNDIAVIKFASNIELSYDAISI